MEYSSWTGQDALGVFNKAIEGASGRVLAAIAAGSIAYLANVYGWGGAERVKVDQVTTWLLDAASADVKRSQAYKWVSMAKKLAIITYKKGEQARAELRDADSPASAAAILLDRLRAEGISTLTELELYLSPQKAAKEKKPFGDRLVAAIEREGADLTTEDISALARAIVAECGIGTVKHMVSVLQQALTAVEASKAAAKMAKPAKEKQSLADAA